MNPRWVRLALVVSWLVLRFPVLSAVAQATTAQENCKISYALKPLDESVVTLLGEAVVPAEQAMFVDPRLQQLQALDFPSKVTAWADRPAAEEMTRRRAALVASSSGHNAAVDISQPYVLRTLPAKDFADLEKWFAKEAPKRVPGLCVSSENAAYILAIGVITAGSAGGQDSMLARTQYDQSATRQADRGLGPNSGTVTPHGNDRSPDELAAQGSSGSGIHTCVYVYPTNGRGGTRREVPDHYYCHGGDNLPKSAITTMLKFIAKTGAK